MSTSDETESLNSVAFSAYYQDVANVDSSAFQDVDTPAALRDCLNHVRDQYSNSLVLDFNDETASVALDLSIDSIDHLLEAGIPPSANARWINVWKPFSNRPLLELFARRYDFSPRLLALMMSEPLRLQTNFQTPTESERESLRSWYRSKKAAKIPLRPAVNERLRDFSWSPEAQEKSLTSDGNLYGLVDNLWHYTSVDWGRTYVCVGYNSLYTIKGLVRSRERGPMTRCIRVWTWLVLCEDGTVISINEDPLAVAFDQPDHIHQTILNETRRNIANILRSLSSASSSAQHIDNPMTLFAIRARLGHTPEETAHRAIDAPSLLLYYLFENWHTSYIMISRRESWYGAELARIRAEMFAAPKLVHVDHLDNIGRELGVLKRHYLSHSRLVSRLLEPQRPTDASLDNLRMMEARRNDSLELVMETKAAVGLGAPITSAARARFQRLKDLIELYALSEVDEYIKQKEGLVATNFNLIAIKESLDVEKLTRITLMITKATFLFLPVSFMTTYFSVQLRDAAYTARQYWLGFAVVLTLSGLAMFIFGIFSGDVSTAVILQPMWRGIKKRMRWRRDDQQSFG